MIRIQEDLLAEEILRDQEDEKRKKDQDRKVRFAEMQERQKVYM